MIDRKSDGLENGGIDRLIRSIEQLTEAVQSLDRRIGAAAPAKPAAKPTPPKAVAPKPASDTAPSDPDAITLCVVGLRGHGRKHLDAFLALPGCRIRYICDVDTAIGAAVQAEVEAKAGYRPTYVRDIREALEDPDLDAVSIATPHHWHALMAIWALQARKHVYLEKPLSHNFREAQSVLAAAQKYGKVVQFGTQLRSNSSLRAAADYMQAGSLGAIEAVHCIVYKPRPAVPPTNENTIPKSVDYDQWCGPAPLAPVTRSRFHYHWHWLWDFGNGALGNNGIHRVDVARIGMGPMLSGIGDRVLSYGGRFGGQDSGETPNVQVAVHRFGERWVIQEVIGLKVKPLLGVSNGVIFYGDENNIVYHAGAASLTDKSGAVIRKFEGKQASHYQNFLDAIAANDPAKANGSLEEGHVSSALCHVGNISYRLGREMPDAAISLELDRIGAPQVVQDVLGRVRRTLTSEGDTSALTLGETLVLDYDAKDGPILRNDAATELLGRAARPGYSIPAPADV